MADDVNNEFQISFFHTFPKQISYTSFMQNYDHPLPGDGETEYSVSNVITSIEEHFEYFKRYTCFCFYSNSWTVAFTQAEMVWIPYHSLT